MLVSRWRAVHQWADCSSSDGNQEVVRATTAAAAAGTAGRC